MSPLTGNALAELNEVNARVGELESLIANITANIAMATQYNMPAFKAKLEAQKPALDSLLEELKDHQGGLQDAQNQP